jgi:hypothetical protein
MSSNALARRGVLALALLVTTGCATKTITLDGSKPLPKNEVATIRAAGNFASITAVDGKRVPWGTAKVQVPPGEHTVSIKYEGNKGNPAAGPGLSGSVTVQPKPHDIAFTAEKGREYELGYPTLWFGRKPYVKDVIRGRDLAASQYMIDPKAARTASSNGK